MSFPMFSSISPGVGWISPRVKPLSLLSAIREVMSHQCDYSLLDIFSVHGCTRFIVGITTLIQIEDSVQVSLVHFVFAKLTHGASALYLLVLISHLSTFDTSQPVFVPDVLSNFYVRLHLPRKLCFFLFYFIKQCTHIRLKWVYINLTLKPM